jgi:phage terminase large subunit GpA-like protein
MRRADRKFAAFFRDFLKPPAHIDIIEWAQRSIDFSDDISAERKRFDISLSPFLAEPLRAWQYAGKIREVVVCGIEQHGKTMIEAIGVNYNMSLHPSSMLCVYPSDDLAEDVNRTKYEPLLKRIPELSVELNKPNAKRKDRYILGAATMFFQGAGTKIMSRSCKVVVLDEEDQYPTVKNLSAVDDARKRTRSYNESILYRVCTPTESTGSIWRAFLAGS